MDSVLNQKIDHDDMHHFNLLFMYLMMKRGYESDHT